MAQERLQKIIARAGLGSRRKSEELILEGRVRVNGIVERTPGTKADPATDTIEVDGSPLKFDDYVYIMFNKPGDCVSALEDPFGSKTIRDYLGDLKESVFHVGRLDFDTEGLLLLTNDGDFCQKATHPSYKVFKTYHACVKGIVKDEELETLRNGIELEDGMTSPAKIRLIQTGKLAVPSHKYPDQSPRPIPVSYVEISIREGRKRQVKRMFEAVGHRVVSLKRTQIGSLRLDRALPTGKWKKLDKKTAELVFKEEVANG